VAANYPDELVVGEPADLVVGVENNEHEDVEYSVVVQLQEVEIEGNETRVVEYDEVDRFETTLAHNETWQHSHGVVATRTGENLRLQYLLFRGDPPSDPSEGWGLS